MDEIDIANDVRIDAHPAADVENIESNHIIATNVEIIVNRVMAENTVNNNIASSMSNVDQQSLEQSRLTVNEAGAKRNKSYHLIY